MVGIQDIQWKGSSALRITYASATINVHIFGSLSDLPVLIDLADKTSLIIFPYQIRQLTYRLYNGF